MPSAEVISYTAHTGYLGRLGTEKFLVIRHKVAADTTNDGVVDSAVEGTSEIYFADRFGEGERTFATNGNDTSVRGHLPAHEYVHWIDLLRHEDPVFLHWTHSSELGQPDADGMLHLSTGPEPPGEGPIDLSP